MVNTKAVSQSWYIVNTKAVNYYKVSLSCESMHSLCFSKERCPPRQNSRVESLKAKVEPLLTYVTVENRIPALTLRSLQWPAIALRLHGWQPIGTVLNLRTATLHKCAAVPRRARM